MPSRINELKSKEGRHSRSSSRSASGSSSRESSPARPSGEKDRVLLTLAPEKEVPTVPYKLRFTLTPDEWDERIVCLNKHREHAARPLLEALYFVFAVGISGGIGYPLYKALLKAVTKADDAAVVQSSSKPNLNAALITVSIVLLCFILLLSPLFLRKYVLQRRLNIDLTDWATMDRKKGEDLFADVQWRVSLPGVFRTSARIMIPVPVRTEYEKHRTLQRFPSVSQERIDVEALGGTGLARADSMSSKSMFEDD